jgi:DNA primase
MDFVEQLKSSVDIVDVVGQYVRLRKNGPRHVGLCPFHTEKTPSFSVHGALQFYKCFGCGAGGDVIKFVMEIERLSFYEALKVLAERYGLTLPKREYSDPETKVRAGIYRMNEIACARFRRALASPAGAEARAYLQKRGVGGDLIETFELGFSDRTGNSLTKTLEKEGFKPEELDESGLVMKRQDGTGYFDRFRGRLMFPIHNERGAVIAFGGRALGPDDEPKYLNSPETKIYKKTHVVFNLHRAKEGIRKNDRAVLVEGYMDVIGIWSAGVHEAVASCGTALTSEQVRTLKRHSESIVVNFDADSAGVKAAERSIQMLLDEGMRVRVLELGGGLDPDEYVKAHGAEAYRNRLAQVPGYFHWLADRARARFDMQSSEGRMAGLQFLLPAIQRIGDKLERAAVASEVATYLSVEPGIVLEYFRKSAAERSHQPAPAAQSALPLQEKLLLNALLASAEARAQTLPRLKNLVALQRFAARRILEALISLHESGAPFSFGSLDGRLEDRDKHTLASVAFAHDGQDEEGALEQALACVRKLEEEEQTSRKTLLKTRVKEAERSGNMEEAMRLYRELSEYDRT